MSRRYSDIVKVVRTHMREIAKTIGAEDAHGWEKHVLGRKSVQYRVTSDGRYIQSRNDFKSIPYSNDFSDVYNARSYQRRISDVLEHPHTLAYVQLRMGSASYYNPHCNTIVHVGYFGGLDHGSCYIMDGGLAGFLKLYENHSKADAFCSPLVQGGYRGLMYPDYFKIAPLDIKEILNPTEPPEKKILVLKARYLDTPCAELTEKCFYRSARGYESPEQIQRLLRIHEFNVRNNAVSGEFLRRHMPHKQLGESPMKREEYAKLKMDNVEKVIAERQEQLTILLPSVSNSRLGVLSL